MKNDNTILLSLSGVIILALIGALYVMNTNTTQAPTPTEEGAPNKLTDSPLTEIPLLTSGTRTGSDPKMHTTENVTFPIIAIASRPELGIHANDVISAFVTERIAAFRADVGEMNVELGSENQTSDFTMHWKALLVSPTLLSLRFDASEYVAGMAHPNNQSYVLNYDIAGERLIATEELFASSTQALPFLSGYTREVLRTLMSDESEEVFTAEVLPGTEPTRENFARVGVTKGGLLVIFDPYQVAPYARGTVEIPIPLTESKELLNQSTADAIRLAEENIIEAKPEL